MNKRVANRQASASIAAAIAFGENGICGAHRWAARDLLAYIQAGWRCYDQHKECLVVCAIGDCSGFGKPLEETMIHAASVGAMASWWIPTVL